MENQQKATEFNPTPEQLVFAEAYIKQQGNVTQAFEEIDKDRTVYYTNWRKQPGFETWLSEYAKTEVLKRIGKWYLIAEKYAEAGSFKHLEMLMQIAKEFKGVSPVQINTYQAFFEKVAEKALAEKRGVPQ